MTARFLDLEHPVRLAHRGSRLLWPENTIEAFAGAVDLGYRYLEIDVRKTRDDVIAGQVVGADGEPVSRARVRLEYKSWFSSGSHSFGSHELPAPRASAPVGQGKSSS